jgi:hypothetical protein
MIPSGSVIRVAPYAYSVAMSSLPSELQSLMQPISHPHTYLMSIQSFRHLLMTAPNQEILRYQASAFEPAIDACINDLLGRLGQSIDQGGVKVSTMINCFCWDVTSAATTGHRFGFKDSASTASLIEKVTHSNTRSLWHESFLRFYPWATKISNYLASWSDKSEIQDESFREIMGQCQEENLDIARTAILGRLHFKSASMPDQSVGLAEFESALHARIVLSFLVGTSDPLVLHLQTILDISPVTLRRRLASEKNCKSAILVTAPP